MVRLHLVDQTQEGEVTLPRLHQAGAGVGVNSGFCLSLWREGGMGLGPYLPSIPPNTRLRSKDVGIQNKQSRAPHSPLGFPPWDSTFPSYDLPRSQISGPSVRICLCRVSRGACRSLGWAWLTRRCVLSPVGAQSSSGNSGCGSPTPGPSAWLWSCQGMWAKELERVGTFGKWKVARARREEWAGERMVKPHMPPRLDSTCRQGEQGAWKVSDQGREMVSNLEDWLGRAD